MRIHQLSSILYIPFVIIGAGIIYYSATTNHNNSVWIIIPAIFISMIYVFTQEINNWWWRKYPPILPTKMKEWLNQYSVFYNNISESQQQEFDRELTKFIETNQFYIVGKEAESVPYDIKGIVAHEAIKLMLLLNENPFNNLNRIVLYKHPFPTPTHKYLHTVEAHREDGVIIFSLEHLVPGLLSPHQYYNIGMHGYLEIAASKKIDALEIDDVSWNIIQGISGLSEKKIKSTIGLEVIEKRIVTINTFLTYSADFESALPELAKKIKLVIDFSK